MTCAISSRMDDMSETAAELPPETRRALEDEMKAQSDQALERIVTLDTRLTQNSLLLNAGGAATTLAFMGAKGDASLAVWPLMCFVVGLIASGAEVRALLAFFDALHRDAIRRRQGFGDNNLTVRECLPPPDIGKRSRAVNHRAGWVVTSLI